MVAGMVLLLSGLLLLTQLITSLVLQTASLGVTGY